MNNPLVSQMTTAPSVECNSHFASNWIFITQKKKLEGLFQVIHLKVLFNVIFLNLMLRNRHDY